MLSWLYLCWYHSLISFHQQNLERQPYGLEMSFPDGYSVDSGEVLSISPGTTLVSIGPGHSLDVDGRIVVSGIEHLPSHELDFWKS